jgi:hypothetical protein
VRLPTRAHIGARLAHLKRKAAIPAGVLLVLSGVRWAFSTWSEVEFAWQKAEPWIAPVAQFLWSPLGLFLLGILWLTVLVLRPVRASPAPAVPRPELDLFDGADVVVLVKNVGAPGKFKATGQIVAASYDHKQKHPFKLHWMMTREELEEPVATGASVKCLVATFPQTASAVCVPGDDRIDFGFWSVDGFRVLRLVIRVRVFAESDPDVSQSVLMEITADHKSKSLSCKEIRQSTP